MRRRAASVRRVLLVARTRLLLTSAWADVLVALILMGAGQYEVWAPARYDGAPVFPGPRLVNALVVVPLLALPLAWRRRAPLVSFAVVTATVAGASIALGGAEGATALIALLVAIYSAVANADRRYLVLGAALLAFVGENHR